MAVPRVHYIAGDTILHRLYPLSKLLVLMLLSISVFIFDQWYVAVAVSVLLVLLYLHKGIGIELLQQIVRPLPLFVVLIVCAHIFLIRSSGSVAADAGAGLLQSLRVVDVLMAAGLFLAVTDPIDLSDSVIRAMLPLRKFGVRVGELALIVMIVFSFLPLITEETKRLRTAQVVRCGFQGRGLGVLRGIIPLLAPLVVGTFRRADEIELALAARCYNLDRPRSAAATVRMGRLDLIVCALGVLLFIAGLCVTSS